MRPFMVVLIICLTKLASAGTAETRSAVGCGIASNNNSLSLDNVMTVDTGIVEAKKIEIQ